MRRSPHDLRVGVRPGTPLVVEIGGEIDVLSAPDLREELLHLIRRNGRQLALDLSGVTFIDCAGVGALVATRRRAQLEGGWLRIVRASPPVRRIIRLLGLAEALSPGAAADPDPRRIATARSA
jgi:anti-sigma B factor antagonist